MSLPELYTIEQAAEYLNRSPLTIRDWVTAGKVPHTRLSGQRGVRFTEEHLLQILAAGERRPVRRPGRPRTKL